MSRKYQIYSFDPSRTKPLDLVADRTEQLYEAKKQAVSQIFGYVYGSRLIKLGSYHNLFVTRSDLLNCLNGAVKIFKKFPGLINRTSDFQTIAILEEIIKKCSPTAESILSEKEPDPIISYSLIRSIATWASFMLQGDLPNGSVLNSTNLDYYAVDFRSKIDPAHITLEHFILALIISWHLKSKVEVAHLTAMIYWLEQVILGKLANKKWVSPGKREIYLDFSRNEIVSSNDFAVNYLKDVSDGVGQARFHLFLILKDKLFERAGDFIGSDTESILLRYLMDFTQAVNGAIGFESSKYIFNPSTYGYIYSDKEKICYESAFSRFKYDNPRFLDVSLGGFCNLLSYGELKPSTTVVGRFLDDNALKRLIDGVVEIAKKDDVYLAKAVKYNLTIPSYCETSDKENIFVFSVTNVPEMTDTDIKKESVKRNLDIDYSTSLEDGNGQKDTELSRGEVTIPLR